MQFPRPRLPSFPSALGRLLNRPFLLYSLYAVAVFLIFLVYTFPGELIVDRALELAQNPVVDVNVRESAFAWFRGFDLKGVRLTALPLREGVPPVLEITRLRIRPDYTALIKGNYKAFLVSGELYGGHIEGLGSGADGSLAAQLEWSDLDIGRYRTLTRHLQQGDLSGVFSGASMLAYAPGDSDFQGTIELALAGAALVGAKIAGFVVPDFHFEEARTKGSLHGDRLEIEDLVARGDEVNIQASGEITVRQPAAKSALNLRVTLQPGKKSADTIKLILSFLPRPAATREKMPILVTGTLERPRFR